MYIIKFIRKFQKPLCYFPSANRARGLVGYDVALTWRRSRVQISPSPYIFLNCLNKKRGRETEKRDKNIDFFSKKTACPH